MDPSNELDRIERKIRSNESQVAATIEMHDDSLEVQLAELDGGSDVEDELAAIKAGLGQSPEAIGRAPRPPHGHVEPPSTDATPATSCRPSA
jgi:phage shock protein A